MVAAPSTASSSAAAFTVTVRAVDQSAGVNVSVAGVTVRSASPPDRLATDTVTAAVGRVSRTTSYAAVPPSGTASARSDTDTPAVSPSDSVAVTPATATPT